MRSWPFIALLVLTSSACSPIYTGRSETLRPDAFRTEVGWTAVQGVPELKQKSEIDCGPVALAMVAQYWEGSSGSSAATETAQRASAGELRDQARARGYSAFLVVGTLNDIERELSEQRPMIVGMAKPTTEGALGHYEVVVGMHRDRQLIATLDPALGRRQYTFDNFLREWIGAGRPLLVLLGPPRKEGEEGPDRALPVEELQASKGPR